MAALTSLTATNGSICRRVTGPSAPNPLRGSRLLENPIAAPAQTLDSFFRSVQARAFRRAEIASGNRTDAMDIVQDAMLKLTEKYGNANPEDWPPLFYRIVQNSIRDWHRRQALRSGWRWLSGDAQELELENAAGNDRPEHNAKTDAAMATLEQALQGLPMRQQQVFLLRNWEELSVTDTATAMGCSEGSVKTHYSRAVHKLREQLGPHWP